MRSSKITTDSRRDHLEHIFLPIFRQDLRPQSIGKWKRVPAGRVIALERLTGVPREKLRPDLY
jgi:hypothetical protein